MGAKSETIRPAPIVAVAHRDVWQVRELSDLLQKSGMRVMLLSSSSNALQLVSTSRCDVLMIGDGLATPTGPELCRLLRDKLGERRPWFVHVGERLSRADDRAAFDVHAGRSDPDLPSIVASAVRTRRAAVPVGPRR